MNPNIYVQIIFDKDARPFNGERTVFATDGARKVGYSHAKRIKLDVYLIQYTKNSKWIKDLNIKAKTIKQRMKLHRIGIGNDFLNMISKALGKKNRLHKIIFNNCASDDTIDRVKKGTHGMAENICKSHI